jgi:hypothetical protein
MHLYMATREPENHSALVIGHCHPSALGRAVKCARRRGVRGQPVNGDRALIYFLRIEKN